MNIFRKASQQEGSKVKRTKQNDVEWQGWKMMLNSAGGGGVQMWSIKYSKLLSWWTKTRMVMVALGTSEGKLQVYSWSQKQVEMVKGSLLKAGRSTMAGLLAIRPEGQCHWLKVRDHMRGLRRASAQGSPSSTAVDRLGPVLLPQSEEVSEAVRESVVEPQCFLAEVWNLLVLTGWPLSRIGSASGGYQSEGAEERTMYGGVSGGWQRLNKISPIQKLWMLHLEKALGILCVVCKGSCQHIHECQEQRGWKCENVWKSCVWECLEGKGEMNEHVSKCEGEDGGIRRWDVPVCEQMCILGGEVRCVYW